MLKDFLASWVTFSVLVLILMFFIFVGLVKTSEWRFKRKLKKGGIEP